MSLYLSSPSHIVSPSDSVPHLLSTPVYAGCICLRIFTVRRIVGMNPLHDLHMKIQSPFACVNDIILLAWCGFACGRDIIMSNDRESANLICCFLAIASFVLECKSACVSYSMFLAPVCHSLPFSSVHSTPFRSRVRASSLYIHVSLAFLFNPPCRCLYIFSNISLAFALSPSLIKTFSPIFSRLQTDQ